MFNKILSIFLEPKCPLCDRPTSGDTVCRDCDRQLHQCQLPNPKRYWQGDLPLFAWGTYDGILKRAIATTKYDDKPQLGSWLGAQLGQSWQQHYPQKQNVTVVPIPMHFSKQKQRGFNQSEVIARTFAQVNRLPYDPKFLSRTKATRALFNLDLQQRQKEIRGAFSLKPAAIRSLKSRPVLLVDDIYTSGTTAQEAQRTLQKHGIKVLGIAAIATPKSLSHDPRN